jgi:hypothetical protein
MLANYMQRQNKMLVVCLFVNRVHEQIIETFSLTFTANVKPQTKFFILQLYYNSFYTSFEIY